MRVAISFLGVGLDRLGGVEVKIRNILDGLLKEGLDIVTVQTINNFRASKKFYSTLEASSNIRHITIEDAGDNRLPWNFIRPYRFNILKKLRDKGVDLIDTNDPYFGMDKRSFPLVYSTNFFIDYAIEILKSFEFRYAYLFLLNSLFEGSIIKNTDHFIIENSIQKKRLMGRYGRSEDDISVIPGGFNPEWVNKIRCSNPVKEEGGVILYSGRIDRYKGMKELLTSFREISEKRAGWKLWLVGDGPARRSMEKNVKRLKLGDRVKFWGVVQGYDVFRYVYMCDIFVLPSYIESLPVSLIEAMGLGKPVISTDVGAISSDLVDSSTGVLVHPKDVEGLSRAMLRLIDDEGLRNSLGLNAEKRVEGFTWKNLVKKTIKAYDTAIDGFE